MKVKCIDKGKINNLTVGKEYEVLYTDDTKFHVINDNKKEARYSKHLFSDNDNVEYEFDILNLTFIPEDSCLIYDLGHTTQEEIIDDLLESFEVEESNISCGIKEASGLNTFMSRLDDLVSALINNLTELNVVNIDKDILCKKIFDLVFDYFLKLRKGDCLYLLISTNTTNNPDLNLLCNSYNLNMETELDFLSDFNYKGLNPNSNNQICMWGFKMN